jgi:hypothetical protein
LDDGAWAPSLGTRRAKDSKYYRILELYWLETCITHELVAKELEKNEFLLQLDEITSQNQLILILYT